jgi:hypothetical protein
MADAFLDQSRDTDVPKAATAAPATTSRALVPLTVTASVDAPAQTAFRPDARFVAHLIATATHAPQTRTHRRAAVEDVTTTYFDASLRDRLPVAANGVALSRVA